MNTAIKLSEEFKEFLTLVRAGKLFEVQRWIADGKPIHPAKPCQQSLIQVAMDTGFHSMFVVLLEAGVNQDEKDALLERAVWDNKFEMVTLLTNHGANIHSVDFEVVCHRANQQMMRFFLDHGIDAVTNHPFARALEKPQKPHLGIYFSYRDKIPELTYQLNLALRYHAEAGSLKWVSLLLWAGANGHIALPDINGEADPDWTSTALEEAVYNGNLEMVEKIKIDPKVDDLGKLLHEACFGKHWPVIEKLLDLGVDPNNTGGDTKPMENLVWHLERANEPHFGFASRGKIEEALSLIIKFADRGGRWQPGCNSGINSLRRSLYRADFNLIMRIIKDFKQHNVCHADILHKLVNTVKMKKKLGSQYSAILETILGKPEAKA